MAELEAAQRELSLEGFKMEKQGLSDSIIRLKEQILENNRTIADQEEKINSIPPDYLEQVAAKRKALDEAFEKDKRIKEDELEALKAEVELKKQEADSEIAAIALSLEKARSAQKAIIEENKRREEMAQHRDFYRIQLSDSDKKEIAQLREVEQSLRDPEPLRKVIWSYYYQNAAKDMINRVLGKEPKTGIYKITNIDSGRCYVGQSAEISTRWLSHIKRGLGAEKATKNKLYPEMLKLGPENFTFEIIEECSRADLDAREDYWQEHFGAMEFGYSIK